VRQLRPAEVKSLQRLNTEIEVMNTNKTKAYAAQSATSPLASATIPRREPTPRDVKIEILFCGICHSDLHYARMAKGDVKYRFSIDMASLKSE
jgi:hypothetical protein